MDIIYTFSQMSGHAHGANFTRGREASEKATSSGDVNKRNRTEVPAELTTPCSDSVLGYLCSRYTRALRTIERLDSSTQDQLESSKGDGSRLALFSKGEAFKTMTVLRLLAAGARQHPVLRDWLWSAVAGLPKGANSVAMTLRVVRLQEEFLLSEWARVTCCGSNSKGIHSIEAERSGTASLMAVGGAWLLSVLTELENSCRQFFPVAFPPLTQFSAEKPSYPSDGSFDHKAPEATASFLSIDEFAESLFSSLDPAGALQELPPQLSIYALLRSPSKRYFFINSLLCNPDVEPPFVNKKGKEDTSAEASDLGVEHPVAFDPLALLSPQAYAWLIPLWNPEEDQSVTAASNSSSLAMKAETKLICRPPPDGGLSWLCDCAALPVHYERRLHENFTHYLCGGAQPSSRTPPPKGFRATTSSEDLTSFDKDFHSRKSFTSDAYMQLRSSASYDAALGVAAVLLAEHLQQASVALSQCYHSGDSSANGSPHQIVQQQKASSSLKGEGNHFSRLTFAEDRGEGPCGTPVGDSTPLEHVLMMMQLDEEVVCGSYEGTTRASVGNPRYGDLLRLCKAAWTALVATLAIGEGIPAQFVRMCLDPLEVSLRACPVRLRTLECGNLSVLRNYLKESSFRNHKASSIKNSPQHSVADTADTPSDTKAKKTRSVIASKHPHGSLDESDGENNDALTYRAIFPPPIFLLHAEDVALYTLNSPFAGLPETRIVPRKNRESELCLKGVDGAPNPISNEARPLNDSLPHDVFDCPLRCHCISSSMATVVAVALRHPRVEMFQLECIWQLLCYNHYNDKHQKAQIREKALHTPKGSTFVKRMGLPVGEKSSDSMHGRLHDDERLSELHGDGIEGETRWTRLMPSERVQHERIEELERRMQRIFDCFTYSTLAGVSPCMTWQQKSSDKGESVKGMRLDGCVDEYRSSSALSDSRDSEQATHLAAFSVASRRINLKHDSKGGRRVLKLVLGGKETKADSQTRSFRQDSSLQYNIPPLDVADDPLNATENSTVEMSNRDLSKDKGEWENDIQSVLQLVKELSSSLETSGLAASLQNIFDALLAPLETLWTTRTTSDMSNSVFAPENTGGHDKGHVLLPRDGSLASKACLPLGTSLFLASSRLHDSTCRNLQVSKGTECTLKRQESRQLLTLATPEYLKQFQNVLSILFQTPNTMCYPISSSKPGCCNTKTLHFKYAAFAVQNAMKATVRTILCFCIYRFLLYCYLQVRHSSGYGGPSCVDKEAMLPESINRNVSEIAFAKQEVNQNFESFGISGGVSLKEPYTSLQKKLRLVVQHSTSTLKPVLESYVGCCPHTDRSDIEAAHNFNESLRRRFSEKVNKNETSKMYYGPVSSILLPMVLRAYEAALKPELHNAGKIITPEVSGLKDMLKQYGVIL